MNGKWIDLHCHLDGSLDVETTFNLAKERDLIDKDMPLSDFMPWVKDDDGNIHLYDYLKLFELPGKLLQDEEALRLSTKAAIKNLALNNNLYTEIRFAPQLHIGKGLTMDQIVSFVIDATKEAEEEYGTKVNLLLCMMVGGEEELNRETIEVAHNYLGNKVVGIDIAGPEGLMPMSEYKELFEYANFLGVPFTIHAGEIGSAEAVHEAVSFGARRIGHGGRVAQDETYLQEVIDKGITLEMCPTSNVQCHNQPSYDKHIIKYLYGRGVLTTINTDNRTISNTTSKNEVELCKQHLGFTDEDIDKMMHNAINAAFISEEEKQELHNAYEENKHNDNY